jgi:tetratricopeptide (TPR) repeat protein
VSAHPERRGFRIGIVVAVLALVALVAYARYYAAGMHSVYFSGSSQTLGALAHYLVRDYAGAAAQLRAHFAAGGASEVQDDFFRAGVLFERKQDEEALAALRALVAAAPEKPIDALALAAIAETRLGRYEAAIGTWQSALRYGEPGPRLFVYVAALESAATLRRAPAGSGRDALLSQLFCYLHYFDRGMARSVRRHARAAIVKDEYPAPAWTALGILYSRQHDADAALAAFERAAEADPKRGLPHYYLALEYSDRGDLAGELRSALAGYAAEPDWQTAQWVLSLLTGKFGDYHRVVRIGKERLAEGRREHGVLFEMGRAFGALGDYPAAIGSFAQALELQPRDANTMTQLAYWNAKAGHRAEAIVLARQAAALRPDWAYPLRLVARALAEDFHYAEAIPAYEQAFAIEAPKSEDLGHLCALYHSASRWQQGLACFQTVLQRDPNNARARRMLSEAQNNLALAKRRDTEGRR